MKKQPKKQPKKIWTDGSQTETCFIIDGQKPVRQPASEFGLHVTGNVGEYYAVMRALQEASNQKIKDIVVYADSQLLVRQLTHDPNSPAQFIYETKNPRLRDLRRIVMAIIDRFDSVTFKWIPREQNLAGKVLEGKHVS